MIGHNIQCFFLVEHLCSEKFIKEQALQLLMTPCRNFDFMVPTVKSGMLVLIWSILCSTPMMKTGTLY